MKKKISKTLILCVVVLLIFPAFMVAFKWNSIFQRGNPIPYIAAMVKLSDKNSFEAVANTDDTYITRRDDKQQFFQMIQDTYGLELMDQLGSSYLFSDGEKNYTVASEIYWGQFTVWTLVFEH